jgi:hypothetical protein
VTAIRVLAGWLAGCIFLLSGTKAARSAVRRVIFFVSSDLYERASDIEEEGECPKTWPTTEKWYLCSLDTTAVSLCRCVLLANWLVAR